MARAPGGPGNELSWEEIWERLIGKPKGTGGKPSRRFPVLWIVVGLVVVIWLLTGIYTVGPGEKGIVRRFGDHIATSGPGLHYHLPSPIESIKRVNVEEIRTAEIGFRTGGREVSEESHMLTQDENIVEAQVVVQYKVKEPADFLFNVLEPEQVLHDATEVALRSVVGDQTIDYVMIAGRSVFPTEVQLFLQELLDDYGAGITVTNLKLQYAGPPEEVEAAFNEVQAAREDKQTLIREAEGYAADRVPKARGEAEKIIQAAIAYEDQRVLKAEGDAAKFLQVLRMHEVPAAFDVLARDGVPRAIEALTQIGTTEGIGSGTTAQIAIDQVISKVVGEGTSAGSTQIIGSQAGITREALYDILSGLGATTGISSADELTGQKLTVAFERLTLADEFRQAYEEAISLTVKRLYLETMEEILPSTEKIVIDSSVGQNVLPFLPLQDLGQLPEPAQSASPSPTVKGAQ
ncbi:MAG: FtsH protease activity modulator HflK [Dehalococcoidia bacterium]